MCLKGDLNRGRELHTGAAGVKQPGREELQAYSDYWDGERGCKSQQRNSKTGTQEESRKTRVSTWEFEPLQEQCSAETESPETDLDREELRAQCRIFSQSSALQGYKLNWSPCALLKPWGQICMSTYSASPPAVPRFLFSSVLKMEVG